MFAADIDAAALKVVAGCEGHVLDVRDPAAISSFAKLVGPVHVLFNCACLWPAGTVLDVEPAQWDAAFELNVKSMYHMIRAFLPGMIAARGGSIVNMSSVAGSITGVPDRCAYGATKAAVIGLTKSVAADFVTQGIRCNAICPGTVDTPSLQARLRASGDYARTRAAFETRQPMGRLGKPGEIAALALHLASDESGFTTGQIHIIDGGWMISTRNQSCASQSGVIAFVSVAASAVDLKSKHEQVLELAEGVARRQLARLDAAHITHMKEESRDPRSWEQGAFWLGMTHLVDAGGEQRFRKAILAMGRANAWTPGPRVYHADDHVIAQSYLWAARHGAGPEAFGPLRAVFDQIRARPAIVHLSFVIPAGGYGDTACLQRWCWCDALFMSPPAWIELSRQLGDTRYATFALEEFWATTDFLYDPAEKLYFRDSRFFERRDDQGRKLFWSRGNGWVFAGIASMLAALPQDHPDRPRLVRLFRDMAARLVSLQKPDGYWPPSLLAPDNSPPETSGTGFYVYGLAWGTRQGILKGAEYRPAIDKGWAALARAVAKDGKLGWVQQVSDRPEQVAEADTQFYGVGAFLLAASAVASIEED